MDHCERFDCLILLNKWGDKGWELCATLPDGDPFQTWYIFKRPINN